ncbi:hypothetical protein DFP93_103208 [Aneurinibacillus soli]|uniref:DUF4376 domain-containing protein n=1 Tax=Aneurinibacillus soli TaxID=1500254 RepID=A0A0U5AYZ2_9BACL|nr:hypothetical protein [Aneurinibacillus soli]PYE62996.1 hypothetical protein DFP93_103208 [Aneurinibacillus soli]BAU28945.1 hypothetical protein CB4_03122 [Aneurinibacillus soli]
MRNSYVYAQLNENSTVVGILESDREVDSPSSILIDGLTPTLFGATYDRETGEFRHLAPVVDFATLQQQKNDEMSALCEQKILENFYSSCTGTNHEYGYSAYDQLNYNKYASDFALDPTVSEVPIKTKDAGPILHSREAFLLFMKDAKSHELSAFARFWEIEKQIANATTEEELNTITWEVTDGTTAV